MQFTAERKRAYRGPHRVNTPLYFARVPASVSPREKWRQFWIRREEASRKNSTIGDFFSFFQNDDNLVQIEIIGTIIETEIVVLISKI